MWLTFYYFAQYWWHTAKHINHISNFVPSAHKPEVFNHFEHRFFFYFCVRCTLFQLKIPVSFAELVLLISNRMQIDDWKSAFINHTIPHHTIAVWKIFFFARCFINKSIWVDERYLHQLHDTDESLIHHLYFKNNIFQLNFGNSGKRVYNCCVQF